jgi:hypothetical protein
VIAAGGERWAEVVGVTGDGGRGLEETIGIVIWPGWLTGKVVPEIITAVDCGGTDVVKSEVTRVKEVARDGGRGLEETIGMVTWPGWLTGKVVPEIITAVDCGGTDVVKNEVMRVKEVVRVPVLGGNTVVVMDVVFCSKVVVLMDVVLCGKVVVLMDVVLCGNVVVLMDVVLCGSEVVVDVVLCGIEVVVMDVVVVTGFRPQPWP